MILRDTVTHEGAHWAPVGAMGEDRLHMAGGGEQGKSAQERIDEIHSWQHSEDPVLREKYKSDPVQAELRGLYQRLEGDGPIVGAGGRTL